MWRELEYNGERLHYILTRKRVKNYNLRVHPDGSVALSVPHLATTVAVEAFLCSRWDWITAAQARLLRRASHLFHWGEDTAFSLLGEEVVLLMQIGSPEVIRQGDTLIITLPDPQNATAALRLAENWYLSQALEALETAHRTIWPLFDGMGLSEPKYKLRWMTARWGSCRSRTGDITLNKRLFALPRVCLEYVLVHECAHLPYPDHGREFRALVAKLLPDCRAREELLREESARCILLR